MQMVRMGTRGIGGTVSNPNESRTVMWACILLFSLILGRAVSTTVFYAFVLVSTLLFLISSVGSCVVYLLFLLPFSTILKQAPQGMSFFTVLFYITILKMLIKRPKIHRQETMLIALLTFYNIVFSGPGQLTTIITMSTGLFMLYYCREEKLKVFDMVFAFSAGICLASLLALLKESLPIVNSFIKDVLLKTGDRQYATRFAGLQGNPNYYTLDVTVALSANVVLMLGKNKSKWCLILFVFLSVFGLLSVSKSFLLVFGLLVTCWFLLSIRQGGSNPFKFLLVGIVGFVVVYCFASDAINSYIYRFNQDSDASLGSITTGRTDIWLMYFREIWDNPRTIFFGQGLNSLSTTGWGSHNTYIECWFMLGIVGSMLFLLVMKQCVGRILTKRITWLPIAFLLLRMMAIGVLTYDSIWFYIVLILALFKNENIQQMNKLSGGEWI